MSADNVTNTRVVTILNLAVVFNVDDQSGTGDLPVL